MREILFRGKRIDNGEWVEGGIIPLDIESGYLFIAEPYLSASTLPVHEIVKNYTHLVIPKTVGQYTGLKDKNGKRIFEGDIVRLPELFGGEIAVIRFFGTAFKASGSAFYYQICESMVVLGNIHDNPEFLEE